MTRRGALVMGLALVAAACDGPGTAPGEPSTAAGGSPGTAQAPGVADPCWKAPAAPGTDEISFSDVTEDRGLLQPLTGLHAHAAAWGDVNGDGWLDLFVGNFADRRDERYRVRGAEGPSPDRLMLGGPAGFRADETFPQAFGRSSGAAFADLDGDADLDLVVSRNVKAKERGDRPTEVLENTAGRFDVVENGGIPGDLVGRSAGVLDADDDGLLDLFVAEDRFSGGSSVLLRNAGGLRFEEATADFGLPPDTHGLGVAAADLTGDGRADLFVAGSNRLFVSTADGFREVDGSVFRWQTYGGEDDVSGVAIADVNRDALPDILLGHHFNSTVAHGERVPVRLYLHRGVRDDGDPVFEDVTEESGLTPLATKAPHVEISDFDNDGWPDVLTTASAEEGTRPAIFRHLGVEGGIPRFAAPEGLGGAQYWVTGPSADVDRDGRLDLALVEFEPSLPSVLLHNETASGSWLSVALDGAPGGGVGAQVLAFEPGKLGDPRGLIAAREIIASQGYAAGSPSYAHLGLGDRTAVDLRIVTPDGELLDRPGIAVNRHARFPGGCPAATRP